LGEDVGELVHRDVDLEDVLAFLLAALALARAGLADRVALAPLAHADAAVVAVTERGDVDVVNRDRDEPLALAADELAAREKAPQVLADLAADDLPEALVVLFDLVDH